MDKITPWNDSPLAIVPLLYRDKLKININQPEHPMRKLSLASTHWLAMYKSNPRTWQRDDLEACTGDELEALCLLLGTATSGTKAHRIERLLDHANLRTELAEWGEFGDTDEDMKNALVSMLSQRYKGSALKALAKRAGTIHYRSKRVIILALLRWRNECRRKGQLFNTEYRAAIQRTPTQLTMRV